MADDPKTPGAPEAPGGGENPFAIGGGVPAAQAALSLSQAVLAPLDAVLKAQIHAARSFLNLVLQLGFPHAEVDEKGHPLPEQLANDGKPYALEFYSDVHVDGRSRRQKVTVPALALVPVAPLAVQSAEFKFDLSVVEVHRHRQIQRSESGKTDSERERTAGKAGTTFDETSRPWFLVPDPVSIRGVIAPPEAGEGEATSDRSRRSTVQIAVKVGAMDTPAALTRLLTALSQTTHVETDEGPKAGPGAGKQPSPTA
jgi:hypothetical protein